ncbi:MAG: dTMP kinase [Deltaproteobacteria bacterium]|nr:dTMP kinase [Deltaproteobacteria bacterium]
MKKGLFITFEGGEGTGKTTQIKNLAGWLKKKRRPFLITREPGGTVFADQIRSLLLDPKNKGMDRHLELLLYLIARQDHVTQKIRPALKKGKVVLCDRFTDATLAYQGYGRGLSVQWLKRLNDVATGGLKPDLTFLFDIPISVGLGRARNHHSRQGQDRFEREKNLFHQKVRRGYLTLARQEKKRFRIVDTRRPKPEVSKKLIRYLQEVLR